MAEKYQKKYRIDSARLKNYDYSQNGAYFVTIVTKNFLEFFGKINNNQMILNELGEITQKYWNEIPQHFPFIKLDEMVVMPNHIHGILWIDNDDAVDDGVIVQTPNLGVSMDDKKISRNKNHNPEWKQGTIGVIINQFKRICTIKSRKISPAFAWQPRFHDRIIRNENELNRIREYIIKNPEMWERDRNNNGELWL